MQRIKNLLLSLSLITAILFVLPLIVKAQSLDPSLQGYEEVKPPERPTVKIISPQSGSIILGNKIGLDYITNGKKHKIIFAKEGAPVPSPIYTEQKPPIYFDTVPEGNYRITVEAIKNNDKSYNPPSADTTKFSISHPISPIPTLSPTSTPIPIPIYKQINITPQHFLLAFALLLISLPSFYLLLRKK